MMNTYTMLGVLDQAAGVEALPVLPPASTAPSHRPAATPSTRGVQYSYGITSLGEAFLRGGGSTGVVLLKAAGLSNEHTQRPTRSLCDCFAS